MGGEGTNRRTKSGEELLEWCVKEELIVASIFFKQRERGTWFHLRFGFAQELDHFLLAKADRSVTNTVSLSVLQDQKWGSSLRVTP